MNVQHIELPSSCHKFVLRRYTMSPLEKRRNFIVMINPDTLCNIPQDVDVSCTKRIVKKKTQRIMNLKVYAFYFNAKVRENLIKYIGQNGASIFKFLNL